MKKYFALFILLLLASVAVIAQTDPPSDPEPGLNIWTIVSGVLAVLGTVFATAFVKIKKKIGQVVLLARKTVDLLETITNAISDNSVDQNEILAIKEDIQEVKAAWRGLWGKV